MIAGGVAFCAKQRDQHVELGSDAGELLVLRDAGDAGEAGRNLLEQVEPFAAGRKLVGAEAGKIDCSSLVAEPLSLWAPGRGDFLVSNFHPGAIPGNLVKNDFWR